MASLAEQRMIISDDLTPDDAALPVAEARPDELRHLEALLFASHEPLDEKTLAKRLPDGVDVGALLKRLQEEYSPRGVNLVHIGNKWGFRTANDLRWLLTHEIIEQKKLSRAAIETLAIIAYHQPVTRHEIEEIRGVTTAKGTIDVLLETGWLRLRGRRKTPGRPLTYGTSETFLRILGRKLSDLPGRGSQGLASSMRACLQDLLCRCPPTIMPCAMMRTRWNRKTSILARAAAGAGRDE